MRMSPAVTSSRPAIILRVVVFPQPEGPTRMQSSRSRTVSSIPATTSVSPNRLTTLSRTTFAIVVACSGRREWEIRGGGDPPPWWSGAAADLEPHIAGRATTNGTAPSGYRPQLLLRVVHRRAHRLSLGDFGEHRRDD